MIFYLEEYDKSNSHTDIGALLWMDLKITHLFHDAMVIK